nr:hypothetical protein [Crateriforma conspicua]
MGAPFDRIGVIVFGCLQIIRFGHFGAMAEPIIQNVVGMAAGPFAFRSCRRSQVHKRLGKRFHSGTLYDLAKRGPQVGFRLAVTLNNESIGRTLHPRHRQLIKRVQFFAQLGEQRRHPFTLPVAFRLGGGHDESTTFPVDIRPTKPQRFRWTTQATVSGQRNNHPPFLVGAGVQNRHRFGSRDETLFLGIAAQINLHAFKRVPIDQPIIHRLTHDLPASFDVLAGGVRR